MGTMYNPVKDLMVATGYATETTIATFIASASAGEVAVLQLDGSAAPSSGEGFYIVGKDANGKFKASDKIFSPSKTVRRATSTAPVTVVPAYTNWVVSTTNLAAGDLYSGLVRIFNFGSQSVLDESIYKFDHTFVAADTVTTVAQGLIESLSANFSKVEGQQGQYVNFKTGYADVFTTEAAALAAVGDLTDTNIVWVMENNKPYTFAASGSTFASNFTEKTDWSTELGLSTPTAEYLQDNPWFHFIKKASSTVPEINIIAKIQSGTNEKAPAYDIEFKAGIEVLDSSDSYNILTANAAADTAMVKSPGDGRYIRDLEVFCQGHTGDDYRGIGYPNNFSHTYVSDVDTNYYVIDLAWFHQEPGFNAGTLSEKSFQVACSTSAAAASLIAAINTAVNAASIALGDLSDVTLTSEAENEIIKLNGSDIWVNAADATA